MCVCIRWGKLNQIIPATRTTEALEICLLDYRTEQDDTYVLIILGYKCNHTVFSLWASSSLFILSGNVKGILVLLSLVIHGCLSASLAEYLCAMLNLVNFMNKFRARLEICAGQGSYLSFDNFYWYTSGESFPISNNGWSPPVRSIYITIPLDQMSTLRE